LWPSVAMDTHGSRSPWLPRPCRIICHCYRTCYPIWNFRIIVCYALVCFLGTLEERIHVWYFNFYYKFFINWCDSLRNTYHIIQLKCKLSLDNAYHIFYKVLVFIKYELSQEIKLWVYLTNNIPLHNSGAHYSHYFSHFFPFFNNNLHQNILTFFHFLYHINNFFIIIQIKKFTTIQNFFTFLYKFFLLYIASSLFITFKINNLLLCSVPAFAKQGL